MPSQEERQAIIDEEQLRWLPIGYWVTAGFWGAYGLFMLAYFVFIGAIFVAIPSGGDGPPPQFGWIFLGFGLVGFLVMAALVTFKVLAGFWIRRRKHRVATMVVAAITCLEVPYGTVLGVLTFLVLARPTVRALYDADAPGSGSSTPPMTSDDANQAYGNGASV